MEHCQFGPIYPHKTAIEIECGVFVNPVHALLHIFYLEVKHKLMEIGHTLVQFLSLEHAKGAEGM